MKIKYQILFAPFLALLFLLICGGIAYQAISEQDKALAEISGIRLTNMLNGVDIAKRVSTLHTEMFRVVSWYNAYDTDTQTQLKHGVSDQIQAAQSALESWLASSALSLHEQASIHTLQQQLKAYQAGAEEALFMLDLDVNSALGSMHNVENLFQALKATFDEFNTLQQQLSGLVFDEVKGDSKRSLALTAVLVVAAVMIASLVALFTAKNLLRQLGGEPADAVRIAKQIAEGDLTHSYPKAPQGSLLESMGRMQQELSQMVRRLSQLAQTLAGQSQQMSESSQEVAKSSAKQCQSAISISATVEEMSGSINSVSDNAQTATRLSQNSGEQAKTGSDIILRAANEMEMIATSVTGVSGTVAELGESSEKISSVVTVIQTIAEQTNLLALNAAIEAARAGEQGRGFAVVADEVRGLASRTAESTSEISTMINVIQTNVATAIEAMEKSVEQVEQGVVLANSAGESIVQISTAADQALDAVGDISHALAEQTAATNEIAVSIENIASMSTSNSEQAEHSATDAKELAQIAIEIREAIGQFRLELQAQSGFERQAAAALQKPSFSSYSLD